MNISITSCVIYHMIFESGTALVRKWEKDFLNKSIINLKELKRFFVNEKIWGKILVFRCLFIRSSLQKEVHETYKRNKFMYQIISIPQEFNHVVFE